MTSICNSSNRMLPITDDISMEGNIVWLPINWESLQFSRAILVGSHILLRTTGGNIFWRSGSPWDCITFITVNLIVSPWSRKQKGGRAVPVILWWEWKWDLWWERKWEILWDCIGWILWGFDWCKMCWLECMGRHNKLVTCVKLNVRSRIVGWFHGFGIWIRLDGPKGHPNNLPHPAWPPAELFFWSDLSWLQADLCTNSYVESMRFSLLGMPTLCPRYTCNVGIKQDSILSKIFPM